MLYPTLQFSMRMQFHKSSAVRHHRYLYSQQVNHRYTFSTLEYITPRLAPKNKEVGEPISSTKKTK